MGLFDWLLGLRATPAPEPLERFNKRPSSKLWSYCESDFGTADPSWCIRRLTLKGRTDRNDRRSRIDTPSLCGKLQPGQGWDLYSVVQEDQNLEKRACPKCRAIFYERMKRASF